VDVHGVENVLHDSGLLVVRLLDQEAVVREDFNRILLRAARRNRGQKIPRAANVSADCAARKRHLARARLAPGLLLLLLP
jgi:hypothetical protein